MDGNSMELDDVFKCTEHDIVLIDPTRRLYLSPVEWTLDEEFKKKKEKLLGDKYDRTGNP